MRAFVVSQDSTNFYLLDVYANNNDGDREEELQDPMPVKRLRRKDGRRPAILIGLRCGKDSSIHSSIHSAEHRGRKNERGREREKAGRRD